MPPGFFFSPAAPGVTRTTARPTGAKQELPGILAALKETGPMSAERAKRLLEIAKEWFRAHRWYYLEALTCAAHDAGSQWGYPDATRLEWIGEPLAAEADQIRITVNLTKPINDQATAMITQDAPIMKGTAGNSATSAAAAAEV